MTGPLASRVVVAADAADYKKGRGFAFGHTCGVKVQRVQRVQKVQRVAVSPYRAMSFIMPPSAVTSTSSIIIILTLVHPFATSWPSSPKGDARTLRDWLSVSSGMIRILVISRCAAPPYPAAPDFPPSGGQNKTPRAHSRHFDESEAEWRNLPL